MNDKTPKRCCKTCGHAIQKETGIIGAWVGECRAQPPSPVLFPVPNGGARLQWVWPIVDETVLCGRYCPKEHLTEGN